ncbi:AraC family transcriptional regulator [Cricetibacter osteomyelitidis]|nr:AraC family transcriptional regulator [Cricetibacter osteomyelitidis]
MLQYTLAEQKISIFENCQQPKLLFIANTCDESGMHPRMLHKHDDHLEIVFVAKGYGNYMIDGQQYDTKEGDILIFNQGVIHDEMAQLNSTMTFYCCGITNLKLKGLAQNCLFDVDAPAVIQSGEYKPIIEQLLSLMFTQAKTQHNYTPEFCHHLLVSLLAVIVNLPKTAIKTIFYKKLTLVDQVREFLERHYAENLSLPDIAARFNVSTYYLSHLFKAKTGFSPIQYLNRCRIGEAQSLLQFSKQSITQVASTVGYENTNYFTVAFSNAIGISPSAYRNLWAGKNK